MDTVTEEVKEVGIEWARELLLKAIETQGPTFVYITDLAAVCSYSPNHQLEHNSPCLIGVVLRLLGLNDAQLNDLDGANEGISESIGSKRTLDKLKEYNLSFSSQVVNYFSGAQMAQDNGQTWAEAFYAAEKSLLSL